MVHLTVLTFITVYLSSNLFAEGKPDSRQTAKHELSSTIQNKTFKAWEGTYRGGDKTDGEANETEITFTNCSPNGCDFEASAGFEVTDASLPPGGGRCAYSGKVKFLSTTRAVAWNSTNEGDFTGDFASLMKTSRSSSWSHLVFVLTGDKLTANDEAAASDGFCARNTVELVPATRVIETDHSGNAGPAFDCKKARSEAEKAICGSPNLAAKDRELSRKFREAKKKAKAPTDSKELNVAQRRFLQDRDRCQSDVSCLDRSYTTRIEQLDLKP